MPSTSKKKHEQYTRSLQAVYHFSDAFHFKEARKLMHKMIRSAFAQKELLDKSDMCSLLYLKNELEALIVASAALAKHKKGSAALKMLFARKNARQWIASLNELFHAALYDGLFTSPTTDKDIYQTCRRFFKLIKICYSIRPENE
jgi:hypothetical protein